MWYDNRPVYKLSTIHSSHVGVPDNLSTVQRHLKNGTVVKAPCSPTVLEYAENIGEVDGENQLVMLYNSGRKSMKLWKRVLFYSLEDVILDFFVVEKAIRAEHSTTGRSYLDLKMELAMGLIGGKSFRKKAGLPSIGDPVDEIRLQNIGVHLPIWTHLHLTAECAMRRSLGVVLLVGLVLVHVKKGARRMTKIHMRDPSSVILAMLDFASARTETATRCTTPIRMIRYLRERRHNFSNIGKFVLQRLFVQGISNITSFL